MSVNSELNDEKTDELAEILLNTQEQCQMVEDLIKNQINVKDELINKLHKELEYYKQEAADRYVEQVMKAVIKVRKDMVKTVDLFNEDSTAEDVIREYIYILEDLTDLLEQQNIDYYSSPAGSIFDASIHQAKIEQTDIQELDKTIKESISDGYKKGDKVLIPERVIVYQYRNNNKGE